MDNHKVEGYIRFDYLEKENPVKFASLISDVTNMTIFKRPEEGRQYILGCLPPGEKVLTDSGLKNIEDVVDSDKLINENGDNVDIINKQIYNVEDEDVFEIQLNNTYRTTKFTKEHPILVSKNTKLKRLYDSVAKKEGKRYWDFNFNYIV
jgi:preprotein translocase subunit YajC